MFIDKEFPLIPGFGTKGGPGFRTSITKVSGGVEQRNQLWQFPLGRWEVIVPPGRAVDYYQLVLLHIAAEGMTHTFAFKDQLDHLSGEPRSTIGFEDCQIGTGDGVTTAFQLIKPYVFGNKTTNRKITRPLQGTVRSGVGGVEASEGGGAGQWTLDYTTGLLQYNGAPPNGQAVTAGFEFRVPVRFDVDRLPTVLENTTVGEGPVPQATFGLDEDRE